MVRVLVSHHSSDIDLLMLAAILSGALTHLRAKRTCEVCVVTEASRLSYVSDTLGRFGELATGMFYSHANQILSRTRAERFSKHSFELAYG
jgi:hypothetical protein